MLSGLEAVGRTYVETMWYVAAPVLSVLEAWGSSSSSPAYIRICASKISWRMTGIWNVLQWFMKKTRLDVDVTSSKHDPFVQKIHGDLVTKRRSSKLVIVQAFYIGSAAKVPA